MAWSLPCYWKVTDGELQYGLHPQMHAIDQKGFECETVTDGACVSWNFVRDHNKDCSEAEVNSAGDDKDTLGGQEDEPEVKEDEPGVKETEAKDPEKKGPSFEEETQQRD